MNSRSGLSRNTSDDQTAPVPPSTISLEFSDKYDAAHAQQYYLKHQESLSRRLSHRRDCQLARFALKKAGNPLSVLDLPCGAGRFWKLLAENPERKIYAADNSSDMLQVALNSQPPEISRKISAFQTSAFDIDMPDSAVDCIFSMRLMHHVAESEHRLAMLREFHRVCRETVILNLWVDGNFKARKRKRLEQRRVERYGRQANNNRFVIPSPQIEAEFKQAGFSIIGKMDFLPRYSMWRIYVLRKGQEQ